MGMGGRREGAGRKSRAWLLHNSDESATEKVLLAFTPSELAAIQELRPAELPLAQWLHDELLERLFVTCARCKRVTLPDGRGVYGPHVCKRVKA